MAGSIVAFAGKGGVGKTTLAAMTIRQLVRTGNGPILAVDADPNATLALTLGAEEGESIADLRDRMGQAAMDVNQIPKTRLVDQWLAELLVEETGFDLLTMGRPEGRKCYCYVNGLLRRYLSLLRGNYAAVIVDCEAGMEYLSRLVIDDVAALVMVADATPVGLKTVQRIAELADSLDLTIRRRILAVNKLGQFGPRGNLDLPEISGVDEVIEVPFDSDVSERCTSGGIIDEQAGQAARQAVEALAAGCLTQGT